MSSQQAGFIRVKGEPGTGLGNNRMALDLAVGLAYLTNRTLVLYDMRPLFAGIKPMLRGERPRESLPTILDFFDIPVPIMDDVGFQVEHGKRPCWTLPWNHAPASMFYYPYYAQFPESTFHSFMNGRRFAYTISDREEQVDTLHVDTRLLGMYSYFFLLEEPQHTRLREMMRQITPKQAYLEFADELTGELGSFNALHVRRGDFHRVTPNPERVNPTDILHNIKECLPRDELLVICTDDSSDHNFFSPIASHFSHIVFLDRFVLENTHRLSRLKELPVFDDTALALVSQLVAARADQFIGSLFSTFSALIHRARGFDRPEEPFRYACYAVDAEAPPFDRCRFTDTHAGEFSWNRLQYPLPPALYSWFREWPEALL